MKKIFIILILSLTLLISGCSFDKSSQVMEALNKQTANIQEIVSSTSTAEMSDVSPSITIDANATPTSLQTYKATAHHNMMQEEALRQDILSLNRTLQSNIKQATKLNKPQTNAIIELTINLDKNANKLSDSKSNIKNNVKKIKKNLNSDNHLILTELESNYISLNNTMNERYAYMSNIFANLEQLYHVLEIEDASLNDTTQPNIDNQTNEVEREKSPTTTKNIDTFINNNKETEDTTQIQPPIQPMQPAIPHPPYYNGYNYYGYPPNTTNPNRNTDTFRPFRRNIDTYRNNPNNFYYGNNYYNGYYTHQMPPIA